MSWIELSLDTTDEAVDWVCTLLANAIAPTDMQINKYQGVSSKWTFTILMYLSEDMHIHQKIEAIASILMPLYRTDMTTELRTFVVAQKLVEIDATETSSRDSLIKRIGDRFVIVSPNSSYQTSSHPQEIILRLQNSLAFGSGLHPATILSLRLLERHVKPTTYTLDLGSGSGILTVAIAKLGAKVLAIDNDAIAVAATEDAVKLNQVSPQVEVVCGSLGSASQLGHWMGGDRSDSVTEIYANGQFDLIVANIFARVHISLATEFCRALQKPSGILITAGYTRDREADITAAMSAAGLTICDREQIDEWIAIAFCHQNMA